MGNQERVLHGALAKRIEMNGPTGPTGLMDFAGRWHLSRRIEGNSPGGTAGGRAGTGTFEGIAQFIPDQHGLAYEEAGELRLPNQGGMKATRRYLWRDAEQNGGAGINVCFEDGSDFHYIDLSTPVVTAWHDCLPDFYEVSYNFTRWPEWRAIWRVKGPDKDYTMITDYQKADYQKAG